jgi:hypothetical protein
MNGLGTIGKVLTAMLAMAIVLWAEAGLALLAGDQVMQCTMTMHRGQAMSCCPDEPASLPQLAAGRPPCCSVSNAPERPLAFVVSSERLVLHPQDAVVAGPAAFAPPVAQHLGIWRGADALRFVRPILDLKTDLRI